MFLNSILCILNVMFILRMFHRYLFILFNKTSLIFLNLRIATFTEIMKASAFAMLVFSKHTIHALL